MAATNAILKPGDVVGGYRIAGVLGIGGMAVVYRADQLSLHRPVALKVLSGALTRDESFRERFRREALHAARLEHPHIVPVYDSGEHDGLLYIAMRLVEGGTLADHMAGAALSPADTVRMLRPIGDALDAAHSVGLVHRDVKPQNILLGPGEHPYLADFGVAKGGEAGARTVTGAFVGSVSYASPEQIRSQTLTPASDIYSLTAVAFECLTGQLPYPRETEPGIMHAHLFDPPPAIPADAMPGAADLQRVIARGMAKAPHERPRSARALVDALAAAQAAPVAPAVGASAPAAPPPRPQPAPQSAAAPTSTDRRRPDEAVMPERAPRVHAPAPAGRALWLVAAAVFAIVVPLGALVATSGSHPLPPLEFGDLVNVEHGPEWFDRPVEDIPGLRIGRPQSALETATGTGQHVLVTFGRPEKPSEVRAGLPPELADDVRAGTRIRARTVRVDGATARRYDLEVDAGSLSVVVIATHVDDAAIGCLRPPGAAAAGRKCDEIFGGVRLRDGIGPVLPGPDGALARELAAVFEPLARARRDARLGGSSLRRREAALGALETASRRAADALGRLRPNEHDDGSVRFARTGLLDEARGLALMRRATLGNRPVSHDRGLFDVELGQGELRSALRKLAKHGYRLDPESR